MPVVTTSSHAGKPHKGGAIVGIVVLLVLIAAGVFFFAQKGSTEKKTEDNASSEVVVEPKRNAEQTVAKQTTAETSENSSVVTPATVQPVAAPTVKKQSGAAEVTLPNGRTLRIKLPPEGETRTIHAQGRIYELDSEGNIKDNTPPPVFDNPAEERLIGMAVEGGSFIPAFIKGMSDEAAVDLLMKPVVINEDDPPDVVVKKEAVAELKQTALAYIQEGGGTFDDFVDEMASYAKQERKLKGQGLRKVMKFLREGKVEEAKAFKAEFDAVMAEQGFPSLKLPKKFAEKMQ